MNYDCFELEWDNGCDFNGEKCPPEDFLSPAYEERVEVGENSSLASGSSFPVQIRTPEQHLAEGWRASFPFVKGPLCREWIVRASRLRKPALIVALALYFRAGVVKDDFIRRKQAESRPIRCDRSMKKAFGISPSQMSRGLQALREAGLIVVIKGGAGRCPVVTIVNIQVERHGPVSGPRKRQF